MFPKYSINTFGIKSCIILLKLKLLIKADRYCESIIKVLFIAVHCSIIITINLLFMSLMRSDYCKHYHKCS
jgi:hypothetical protein